MYITRNKKEGQKKVSLTGNRTQVPRVTGEYTDHYTIREVQRAVVAGELLPVGV